MMSKTNKFRNNDSKNLNWDEFQKDFLYFFEHFYQESDRGSVIVGAAFLDEWLEKLIKKRLLASPVKKDVLFEGSYAPLRSFSAKIELAYRIDIIDLNKRSSLHLIKNLRNDFAHSTEQAKFKSNSVQNKVRELFNINEKLLTELTKNFRDKENYPSILQDSGNYKGWRHVYNLLISILVCALKIKMSDIEPIRNIND